MVLGRLAHYATDIVLVSTVLAGVKRTTGFQITTAGLPEGPARDVAENVLGVGERVFDWTSGMSYASSWFERVDVKDARRGSEAVRNAGGR